MEIRWSPNCCSKSYMFPTRWNKVDLIHWSHLPEGCLHHAHRRYKALCHHFCPLSLWTGGQKAPRKRETHTHAHEEVTCQCLSSRLPRSLTESSIQQSVSQWDLGSTISSSLPLGLQMPPTISIFLCGLWGSELRSSCLLSRLPSHLPNDPGYYF